MKESVPHRASGRFTGLFKVHHFDVKRFTLTCCCSQWYEAISSLYLCLPLGVSAWGFVLLLDKYVFAS